jgi:hypothetical protein
MIGIIGLTTDMALAWFGKALFPWKRKGRERKSTAIPISMVAKQNRGEYPPVEEESSPILENFSRLEPPVARDAGASPLQS